MPSATYGFTGKPDSSVVKTGSYTIPAGKYARITAQSFEGNEISVDGTTFLRAVDNAIPIAVATGNSSTTSAISYTVPSNKRFTGIVLAGGSNPVTVDGVQVGTGAGPFNVQAGPGSVVSAPASGAGAAKGIAGYVESLRSPMAVESFWVPAGTVMAGSGNYLVQLFTG